MSTASSADGHRGGPVVRALVRLVLLPLDTTDRSDLLARAAGVCREAFPDAVAATICVGDPHEPTVVCAGSEIGRTAITSRDGPCRDAWRDGTTVHSRDLAGDDRWPSLRSRLPAVPGCAALAVPLVLAERVLGVLGLYGEKTLVAPEALQDAGVLARTVSAVLHQVDATARLETTARQLETALESRATIDQAKGMVMAIRGCGPDDAFEILAEVSSSSNIKLRDLAARMVEKASQGIDDLPDQRRDGDQDRGAGPRRSPSS